MCNHGNLSVPRDVTSAEFKDAVDHVRDVVLKGHFKDVEPGTNRRFLMLDEAGCYFDITLVRLSGGRTLIDIPYKHGPHFMWWLQDRVWDALRSKLGGTVCNESGQPDQIFPGLSYPDWIERAHPKKVSEILEYELEYVKLCELLTDAQISEFGIDAQPTTTLKTA